MKILFLGTAAAEGYPGAFCNCSNCLKAKREGGRSLRKRSSILINKDLLIDLPPDLYCSAISHNVDLPSIHFLLITHSHSDHFSPGILEFRKHPFSFTRLPKLLLFCNEYLFSIVRRTVGSIEEAKLELRPVSPFMKYRAGRYRFTPIPANHTATLDSEIPLNYIIEYNGKTILYACDTGQYSEEVLRFLLGKHLDVVIIECTMGDKYYEHHMNYDSVRNFYRWAKENRVLKKGSKFIVTHLAHDGCGTYQDVISILPHSIAVAYDGLQLQL
ncbi:MAG: MBL fold metallo-hydrolase [Thermoproteota archaeon]